MSSRSGDMLSRNVARKICQIHWCETNVNYIMCKISLQSIHSQFSFGLILLNYRPIYEQTKFGTKELDHVEITFFFLMFILAVRRALFRFQILIYEPQNFPQLYYNF